MTLKRSPARLAVLLAALLGTVLAAAPAYAADGVSVQVGGNSSYNVGSQQARTVTVSVDNKSDRTFLQTRRVLVFAVPGLRPEHLVVQRAGGGPFGGGALPVQSLQDGVVAVVDTQTFALRRRDDVNAQYRVRFTTGAPAGEGALLAVAQAREGFQDFQELARSRERSIELRGNQRATPTAEPTTPGPLTPGPNTDAPGAAPPGGSAAAQNPLTNPTSSQDDEGAFGWPLYLIGALLVGGGGVTLWLIFRRRDDEEEVPDQADAAAAWSPSRRPAPQARTYGTPVAPAGAGYAAGPAANPPPRTMVMPPVPDQHPRYDQPPPPVDPWQGR